MSNLIKHLTGDMHYLLSDISMEAKGLLTFLLYVGDDACITVEEFAVCLVATEQVSGEHHLVNQRSLSVVNVCNNRNVSYILHIRFYCLFTKNAAKLQKNNGIFNGKRNKGVYYPSIVKL